MKSKLITNMKNEINHNGYSYLAHAAAIGNDKMVIKGLKESPLAAYQAIYGYAVAGNIKSMDQLVSDCSDKTKAMKMVVRGLVRGNHLEDLYKIKSYNKYKADIVFGYAQAGRESMVAILVNREPSLFEAAVQGYASAGHADLLIDLLEGTQFYGEAISQAAKAGHVALVNQLLAKVGFSEDLTRVSELEKIRLLGFLNKALSAYCKGHHLEAAGDLLKKGGNIQMALDALKVGGKPSLESYIGLLLATPSEKSAALLEHIKVEFALEEDTSLSSFPAEPVKRLQEEFKDSKLTLVSFLSEGSSERVNVLEVLDDYFSPKQSSPDLGKIASQ